MEPGCDKDKLRDKSCKGGGRRRVSHPEGRGEVEVQRAHALSWNPDSGLDLSLSRAWLRGGHWLRRMGPISPASRGLYSLAQSACSAQNVLPEQSHGVKAMGLKCGPTNPCPYPRALSSSQLQPACTPALPLLHGDPAAQASFFRS